jgi:hypothetical protein
METDTAERKEGNWGNKLSHQIRTISKWTVIFSLYDFFN